jgi:HK97 family phage major capsid protein
MERHRDFADQMNLPTSQPLVGTPGGYNNTTRNSSEYTKAFWNALRGRSVSNVLSVGEDTSGGYLVPEEFASELIQALEEQNIFRRIARIVSTSRDKLKVPVATASGTASWIDENEVIPESDSNFSQIILNAYKLGTMMRSSSELIEDSAFNIQAYIAQEFARRIGAREEEAFCVGDGTGKPTGVFTASGAPVGVTAASASVINFDDVIDLFYSLKPPYRIRAVFVTNDSVLKQLRKVKDNNGQYIWQPSVKDGTPDTVLGRPIYTSPYAPEIAADATPLAFGDFSYYWIADRRDIRFRVLNELYAERDQIGFFATERVDGKLILPEAIKLLKMGGA